MKGKKLIMRFNCDGSTHELDRVRTTGYYGNLMFFVKDHKGYFYIKTGQLIGIMSGKVKSVPLYTGFDKLNSPTYELRTE